MFTNVLRCDWELCDTSLDITAYKDNSWVDLGVPDGWIRITAVNAKHGRWKDDRTGYDGIFDYCSMTCATLSLVPKKDSE